MKHRAEIGHSDVNMRYTIRTMHPTPVGQGQHRGVHVGIRKRRLGLPLQVSEGEEK